MRIEKKVQSKYFRDVLLDKKCFEVRLADFRCKSGDTLVLSEQKNGTKVLTGRKMECDILYKFNTKKMRKYYSKKDIEKYGLVILSIRRKPK